MTVLDSALDHSARQADTVEVETFIVLDYSAINGSFTMYGPFHDRDVAVEWARENATTGWSVRPVEPPLAA